MKSLKEKDSIPQISKDYLLNIPKQPETTCSLINPLQFGTHNSTKIYKVTIDEEPENLEVDTSTLIKAIENLELWAEGVIDLYRNLDEEVSSKIDSDTKAEIELTISEIEGHFKHNRNFEIKDMEENINSVLSQWRAKTKYYLSLKNDISDIVSEIENMEIEKDNLDKSDEEYEETVAFAESDIDDRKIDMGRMQRQFEKEESSFLYDIVGGLEHDTHLFSVTLEMTRKTNDELRQLTHYLRDFMYPLYENIYNLKQPMDYLKEIEVGTDTEISLGVISSSDYPEHFNKLCSYLEKNEVINKLQEKILYMSQSKDDLFNLLTLKGYTTIRYYDKKEDYLNSPNDYKVYKSEDNKKEIKNKKTQEYKSLI